MKNKTGELTTTQIVTMIILLMSFVIILFLIFRFNPTETSDAVICHNSVVMAGNTMPGLNKGLQCKTQYVCLTENGNCEGLNSPIVFKVQNKEEIYHALAEQVAGCWGMFGEGKINYVSNRLTKENLCSICSHVLLDRSLDNIDGLNGAVSKDELYSYMANTKYKDSKSYFEYIFGTNDLEGLKSAAFEKGSSNDYGFGNMEIGKTSFVVMGITNEISGWTVAGIVGGVVVGGGIGIASGAWIPGVIIGAIVIGTGGSFAGDYYETTDAEIGAIILQGKGIDNKFMAPTIVEANSEKFKILNCDEILTLG